MTLLFCQDQSFLFKAGARTLHSEPQWFPAFASGLRFQAPPLANAVDARHMSYAATQNIDRVLNANHSDHSDFTM